MIFNEIIVLTILSLISITGLYLSFDNFWPKGR